MKKLNVIIIHENTLISLGLAKIMNEMFNTKVTIEHNLNRSSNLEEFDLIFLSVNTFALYHAQLNGPKYKIILISDSLNTIDNIDSYISSQWSEEAIITQINNKINTLTEIKTAQNELMNIVTIFLGVTVGATATGTVFLTPQTLMIIGLGLAAFCVGTASGVLFGKLMCWATKGKVNPLIGSAGVSAVPMAARVAQKVGQEENPLNFLLMHAMGPNVAGVIGSAVAAGVLISFVG